MKTLGFCHKEEIDPWWPMRGEYVFLIAKSQVFIYFILLVIISEDPMSYFIEMIMLIKL